MTGLPIMMLKEKHPGAPKKNNSICNNRPKVHTDGKQS